MTYFVHIKYGRWFVVTLYSDGHRQTWGPFLSETKAIEWAESYMKELTGY